MANTLTGGGGKDTFKWLSQQLMNSDAGDKITDFGLKGGTGSGQGTAEADVLDLSALLKGYTGSSTVSDYVQAVAVGGKVQIQVDFDGKANGIAYGGIRPCHPHTDFIEQRIEQAAKP